MASMSWCITSSRGRRLRGEIPAACLCIVSPDSFLPVLVSSPAGPRLARVGGQSKGRHKTTPTPKHRGCWKCLTSSQEVGSPIVARWQSTGIAHDGKPEGVSGAPLGPGARRGRVGRDGARLVHTGVMCSEGETRSLRPRFRLPRGTAGRFTFGSLLGYRAIPRTHLVHIGPGKGKRPLMIDTVFRVVTGFLWSG